MADPDALPFPLAAGYTTLALNGAKGGATKYLCLQYLNYARWTSQQFSCNLPRSIQIMTSLHLKSDGRWTPLGFLKFWRPAVTLLNETVRNFSWNLTFFEWKRFLHNAVDKTPENAPEFFKTHLDWLRSLEKKNQANVLTFEAATLGTYLTFFNMAGDNIKTKMQVDPERYPSFRATAYEIWSQHGLLGFTRGSFFKGIYLILGSTLAIGIQERLTEIMAALLR
eukprot:Skav229206  [mRNA]  locus=scaffold2439:71068:73864:+ [translate_table: standard]